MSASAHGMFHVRVGDVVAPLFTGHADGTISIRLTGGDLQMWVCGGADELHAFASTLHRLVNDAVRTLIVVPSPDVEPAPVVIPAEPTEDVA